MPDVKMPDGTIIRNVPEGTTRSQLLARYGKTQAPKREGVANWLSDNVLSPLNEAAIGVPEGIYNAAAAVTDPVVKKIAGLIVGDDVAEASMRQANATRRKTSDAATKAVVSRRAPVARAAGRIGGSLAIPIPKVNALGRLAPLVQRLVQGGVGGAAVREVDEDAAAPAAMGAFTNAALPPALRVLARVPGVQPLANGVAKVAAPALNYLGRVGDDLTEAVIGKQGTPLPSLPPAQVAARQAQHGRALAPLGRKAEARAARLKASGVDAPTTGMVTRDPNSFAFERNTAPIQDVGEDLGAQIRDVEMSLVKKGREIVGKQGGSKGAEATGDAIQKAMDAKRGEMQVLTGRLYDKVRDERGDEIVGTLDSLSDLMNSPDITDNATFDSMRDSLARRLSRLGMPNDGTRTGFADFAVKGEAPFGAPQFNAGRFQAVQPPDEFAALGVRRAGRTSVRGPMDATQQLRAWGGIRDQGGELNHLGIGNAPRKLDFGSNEQFLGRLVNDEGMTLDEATERLWEAGYFNPHGARPTPDDLLTRLRQEAMGERSFLPDDLEEVSNFEKLRADRLKIQEAADNGSPYVEDISETAAPLRTPPSVYEEEAGKTSRGATVKQAEELRKFIRSLGSTADPAVRMMRSKLIDALDDDVVGAVGDDAFKAARASARARFDEFGKTFAGKIADEGIAPERLTKRVLSDTTSLADLRAMRKSLLSGTDEQAARGREAWQGLKAQALDDFLSRSMNDEGKVLGGQLSREFVKQSGKFRELLDPADYKELRRLVLASRDATVAPPGSAVNYSGTGPMLANLFQSAKPAVKQGWLKFFAKHAAAGAISFPAGNVALEVGSRAAASAAQQKAANALMRRVELARSPEATAKAVQQLRSAAKGNPAAKALLDRYGAAIGGTAASAGD